MSNLFWLTDAQKARLEPFYTKSNDVRWRDAPKEYGPPKTLYNLWKRWDDKGVFARRIE